MLRKINTSRAVRTMQELFPEEYDFYPRSWILPEEFQLFCAQAGSQQRTLSQQNPTGNVFQPERWFTQMSSSLT